MDTRKAYEQTLGVKSVPFDWMTVGHPFPGRVRGFTMRVPDVPDAERVDVSYEFDPFGGDELTDKCAFYQWLPDWQLDAALYPEHLRLMSARYLTWKCFEFAMEHYEQEAA